MTTTCRVAGGLAVAVALLGAAPAAPQSPPRTASSLPAARDVIRRHVAAIGGEAALAKVKSRYVWARYERPAQRLKGTLHLYAARPNRRLIKIEYPEVGAEITAFDGTVAWAVAAGGTARLLDRKQLPQHRDESVFDFDLHADSLFRSIETVDEVDFEGRRCYALRLVSGTQRTWFEYYDVKTGLFAGSRAQRETDKEPVTLWTVVEDYVMKDGVRLPRKITLRAGGVTEIVRVIDVKSNAVDDAVFELPAKLRPS